MLAAETHSRFFRAATTSLASRPPHFVRFVRIQAPIKLSSLFIIPTIAQFPDELFRRLPSCRAESNAEKIAQGRQLFGREQHLIDQGPFQCGQELFLMAFRPRILGGASPHENSRMGTVHCLNDYVAYPEFRDIGS